VSEVTGGCQCGAVRYAVEGGFEEASLCHCRMCQRATGGPFAALAAATRARVRWTRGAPALFASSSVAERGFCRDCGTPLSFAYTASDHLNLTIGSLDAPNAARPSVHYGVEGRLLWLELCDGMPEQRTGECGDGARLTGMVSHQAAEGVDHGCQRGTVTVPDGFDWTAPVLDDYWHDAATEPR